VESVQFKYPHGIDNDEDRE